MARHTGEGRYPDQVRNRLTGLDPGLRRGDGSIRRSWNLYGEGRLFFLCANGKTFADLRLPRLN